jgi:hypothetical protein
MKRKKMKNKDLHKNAEEPAEEREPKPFEQQEGESNFWYGRFMKFCLYGPSRSLIQCYRDVMAERDELFRLRAPGSSDSDGVQGESRRRACPQRKQIPGPWRKKVKEFDWWQRAEAWDAEQHRIAVQRVAEALNLIYEAAPEAAQILIKLMRGLVKDADGNQLSVTVMTQMRLAANSILNRAGVVYDGPTPDEEDGQIGIFGIKINHPEGYKEQGV